MSFADSFWSEDYATGVNTLFAKLSQGIVENEEVLSLARRRAEHEEAHGQRLLNQASDSFRKGGFQRDDGATTKKAFEGMVHELEESGKCHAKMAQNLQSMVVKPFGKWTEEHTARVRQSEKELMAKIKLWEKQQQDVKRLRLTYFNKCRLLEESDDVHQPDEEPAPAPVEEEDTPVELGERVYSTPQLKQLFSHMLTDIPQRETRLPILGTFPNVSTGDNITKWISKHLQADLHDSESFGQDLVDNGFLRHLGVGSTFANSSKLQFQWRDKALILAGRLRPGENSIINKATQVPFVGEYVSTYVPNPVHANEKPHERLQREARESDEGYRASVKRLDSLRTDMESTINEHFKFMERCESDRLKALKAVMMDISASISNVIPSLKSSCDTMLAFQEGISPMNDLHFLVESYRTGAFLPRTVTYENYYNALEDQTFGVDLELRARADKKRVPNLVFSILSHMDEHYPDLQDDDQRRRVWLRNVPLHYIYDLRAKINNGKPVEQEVLEQYDPAIVAATLRMYLLELPDSPISASLNDAVKSMYATEPASDEERIGSIVSLLATLRLSNIATLDALMTHFARLMDLTSAPDEYRTAWATQLAPCILRARSATAGNSGVGTAPAASLTERYPQKLLLDLLKHKQDIFSALKKQINKQGSSSGGAAGSGARPKTGLPAQDGRAKLAVDTNAVGNGNGGGGVQLVDRSRPSLTDDVLTEPLRPSAVPVAAPTAPIPQSQNHQATPDDLAGAMSRGIQLEDGSVEYD